MSAPLQDTDKMPIGKRFLGRPMVKVPGWYLDYYHETLDFQRRNNQPMTDDERAVLVYIERNRKVIDKELEGR